jgi:hypothetical protein
MTKRPIPNAPDYFATDEGQIIGPSGFSLKPSIKHGYGYVSLVLENGKKTCQRIHKLILITFVGERKEGQESAHLDGNRRNNRLDNLKWCSHKENNEMKKLHGTHQVGERHGRSKLTEKQARQIKKLYKRTAYQKSNAKELAIKFNVTISTITNIVAGKKWKHLGEI